MNINIPIKLVGDEHNAANVVIEMSGAVRWGARGGWIEGVTFRRPKISGGAPPSDELLSVHGGGRLDMVTCVFDNEGSTGPVIKVQGTGKKGKWYNVSARNGGDVGILIEGELNLELEKVRNRQEAICLVDLIFPAH